MTSGYYFNSHSHKKPQLLNEITIRNAYLNSFIPSNHHYYLSVGIHPWIVTQTNWKKAKTKLELFLNEPKVLALGEVGLDRLKPNWDLQKSTLTKQLEIAEKIGKPVIIHCVKAYSDLFSFIKSFQIKFILHAYHGNSFQTEQFLNHENVFFSLGENSLTGKQIDWLKIIPPNKIFLETDTSKMRIDAIYQLMSDLHNISEANLRIQVQKNFETTFGFEAQFQE